MPRKYINPKRKKKEEEYADKYFKKLRESERMKGMSDESLRKQAELKARDKWKRRQSMREIDTYIPLPNKWVKKLRDKRRKKGLL
tara:strand:- start:346 stop:600 length:255 start_codon:yes stop_codon:yes gene_type:complete